MGFPITTAFLRHAVNFLTGVCQGSPYSDRQMKAIECELGMQHADLFCRTFLNVNEKPPTMKQPMVSDLINFGLALGITPSVLFTKTETVNVVTVKEVPKIIYRTKTVEVEVIKKVYVNRRHRPQKRVFSTIVSRCDPVLL